MSDYRMCNRCVMDTSDSEISFDANGHCNHCNNYFNRIAPMSYQGKDSDEAFAKGIEQIKQRGRGRKYDCVIGISGGIDSSYVAYLAKKNGLRALLVHLNNGWDTSISEQNIQVVVDKLGFDYEVFTPDLEAFRKMQVAFLRSSTPDIESPTDMLIQYAVHHFAVKYDVKYIISGGNFATEGILPNTWFYNAKDCRYCKSIINTIIPGQEGREVLQKIPKFGWAQELYCKLIKGIKTVYFLNYVDYNKDQVRQLLSNELGWKSYEGKHGESLYTAFEQFYILPKKFNVDYRRATFSTQICAGTMTREEALRQLEMPAFKEEEIKTVIEEICAHLQITTKEFDEIMQQKPLSYRDYKNDERKLKFIYSVYRFLTGKKDYRG